MAAGIGDFINGVMWGAGTTLVAAAAFGVIVGSLGKNVNIDDNTRKLISTVLG